MTPNLIKKFLDSRNYDVRLTGNGRWIDQKCAFDSVCFVADCVIEYIRNGGEEPFYSPDIWRSEYAVVSIQQWFGKPDPLSDSTLDEFNKFFRQPMKMFAASGILNELKVANKIEFTINKIEILEYIALRERNSAEFLYLYIEKTLHDSGLWDNFDSFLDEQTNDSLENLKDKFSEFCIKYTPINTKREANRIFIKVLNPLSCKFHKKGIIKGRLSPSIITFDTIMYNQPNWRDVRSGKDKNVARSDFDLSPSNPQLYQYKVSRAAKNLKQFNCKYNASKSEVLDRFSIGEIATHIHHIFPKSQFPQIADHLENLIALTSGQHLQSAHPNGKTSVIDKDYQYICLINKTESIRKNLLDDNGEPEFYSFDSFMHVLDVGLNTDYFQHLEVNNFSTVINGIEMNY